MPDSDSPPEPPNFLVPINVSPLNGPFHLLKGAEASKRQTANGAHFASIAPYQGAGALDGAGRDALLRCKCKPWSPWCSLPLRPRCLEASSLPLILILTQPLFGPCGDGYTHTWLRALQHLDRAGFDTLTAKKINLISFNFITKKILFDY